MNEQCLGDWFHTPPPWPSLISQSRPTLSFTMALQEPVGDIRDAVFMFYSVYRGYFVSWLSQFKSREGGIVSSLRILGQKVLHEHLQMKLLEYFCPVSVKYCIISQTECRYDDPGRTRAVNLLWFPSYFLFLNSNQTRKLQNTNKGHHWYNLCMFGVFVCMMWPPYGCLEG